MRTPPTARLTHPIVASHSGRVTHIDNRRIARLAKLAGAPDVPAAGMRLHVSLGDDIVAEADMQAHARCRYVRSAGELCQTGNPAIVDVRDAATMACHDRVGEPGRGRRSHR